MKATEIYNSFKLNYLQQLILLRGALDFIMVEEFCAQEGPQKLLVVSQCDDLFPYLIISCSKEMPKVVPGGGGGGGGCS